MRTITLSKNGLESMLTSFLYGHPKLGHQEMDSIHPNHMDRELKVLSINTPKRVQKFRISALHPDSYNPDSLCDQSFILAECGTSGNSKLIPGVLYPFDDTLLLPEKLVQAYSSQIFGNPDLKVYIVSDLLRMPRSPKCEISLVEYYGQDLDWLTSGSGYVLQRIQREFLKPKKKDSDPADHGRAE